MLYQECCELKGSNMPQKDAVLQLCMKAVHTGQWHKETKTAVDKNMLRRRYQARQELTVPPSDDMVLHEARMMVTSAMQCLVNFAHEGPQSMVKTKGLISGIDKMVEDTVSMFIPCQTTIVDNSCRSLRMTQLPAGPWREVIDFADLPTDEYLLAFMDDYSS